MKIEWTSVKDALPTDDTLAWVTDGEFVTVSYWLNAFQLWRGGAVLDNEITHWSPRATVAHSPVIKIGYLDDH